MRRRACQSVAIPEAVVRPLRERIDGDAPFRKQPFRDVEPDSCCACTRHSSRDNAYISGVSCRRLTRSSNSMDRAGAGGTGRPQAGSPRLLVRAIGMAIGHDHLRPASFEESAAVFGNSMRGDLAGGWVRRRGSRNWFL
jgi:hypothetical protein